jgi:hypothetical protein
MSSAYAAPKAAQNLYRNITLVNTGLVIKAGPGVLRFANFHNLNAAVRYVKLYNKATVPTEADTPLATIPINATNTTVANFGDGLVFSAGLSIRVTTGLADNDTGAPTTLQTIVNIGYD